VANIKKPAAAIINAAGQLDPDWERAFQQAFDAISGPLPLRSFTLSTLPDASKYTQHVVHVSDASGGAVPAYSDGTDWRRFSDDTVVS